MTSPDSTKPALSQAVLDLIQSTFPDSEHATVGALLQSVHWAPAPAVDERVHLDLLELCGGKLERLRELVATAHVNWRDIILAAEFDVVGDQIIQNERGKRRIAELASRKPKPNS
jgi:hypothetical protein